MPDSEVARMVAVRALVERREVVVDLERDHGLRVVVELDVVDVPILPPPTSTGLPGTSWPALWKTALTL